MKKLLLTLFLVYNPLVLALERGVNAEQLSNTLHAKLAYYADFHQETYSLLHQREIPADDRVTWKQYLHSALLSENYAQALVKIQHIGDSFPTDFRTFYYIFSFLSGKGVQAQPSDKYLKWESSFDLIPVEKRAQFLNSFYHSDLVNYASSRQFMMQLFIMLGHEIQARELLFRHLTSHDSVYIAQISNFFSAPILSVYFESLVQKKDIHKNVDYKPLLLSSDRSFQYSKKGKDIIRDQFSSLADFYMLADKNAWDLFDISSNNKKQRLKSQLEVLKSIYSLNYDQAYNHLQKQKERMSSDDYTFLYAILIHQSEHRVDDGNPLSDTSTINLAYEDKIKEFRFKYLVSHEPDRALYHIHKGQVFDSWEDEVFWEAKIHANNLHYERALGMLNNLMRIKPLDLNIRYLLSQILIDHYAQYDLAENLLTLNADKSPQKLSLLASIASARGDQKKALELAHQVFKEDVSMSVARRALNILQFYEQHESVKYYKIKVIENYPEPWRDQVKRNMS